MALPDPQGASLRRVLTACAVGLIILLAATYAVHVAGRAWLGIPAHFFLLQDVPVLIAMSAAMLALAWAVVRAPLVMAPSAPKIRSRTIALAALAVCQIAWIGRDFVFHGHSLSRDEVMAEMAGAYFAQGHIGWRIPPEWRPYRLAIVPEFFTPYGADRFWTAVYLPVHAMIRGAFAAMGDADLAAPVTLGVGLIALWHNARRLFGGDSGAQGVVMVLALTSLQLVTTAMTPFAMTSHFAFNMVWLACVLRGGTTGHGAAALIAVVASGLHQWHFPAMFILPYVLWFALRRQWMVAAWHMAAIIVAAVVWARLYPLLLIDLLGPPPPVEAHKANGVFDKLASLFLRLDDWQPLLNVARLIAWNNLLMVPLGVLAIAPLLRRWRHTLAEPPIAVPMALGIAGGIAVALAQAYGWGFRYMAGQIGTLCLLGGYGWQRMGRLSAGRKRMLIAASAVFAVGAGAWQLVSTSRYAAGYARTMSAIHASDADVIVVDYRGGYFMTDLVRFDGGVPGRSMVMALHMLSTRQIETLCRDHDVAVMDKSQFWALGVHPFRMRFPNDASLTDKRALMARLGCDTPVIGRPTTG